jgi:hypothetical protein
MIGEIIVFASAAIAAAFTVAWIARPDLRAFIERPKDQFRDAVLEYDRRRKD